MKNINLVNLVLKNIKKRINQFMIDAQNMINAVNKGDEKTLDDIANKYKWITFQNNFYKLIKNIRN